MSAYGNDCHFFYNSTCSKGDKCAFRHCEPAKKCTTTCTFWQQGICSKPNCPYRHAELPTERNRQVIPCYWENQPVGCSKSNCQYQHFKPRPNASSIQINPLVSEPALPDTSVPPPVFSQLPVSQPTPIPGVPVIQPVVVHFSDSEVESEKNSPVKLRKPGNQVPFSTGITRTINNGPNGQSNEVISADKVIISSIPSSTSQISTIKSQIDVTSSVSPITTIQAGPSQIPSSIKAGSDNMKPGQIPIIQNSSQTGILPKQTSSTGLPDLDYFIGRPFVPKSNRSPIRSSPRYDISPDRRSYDSHYSRSPSPRSLSPWRRRSRSPSPRRSRSPRRRSPSYSRDRSRSPRRWSPRRRSPSPRRYNLNKNSISRPQDRYLQSRRPGYGRQSRGHSPSLRGQKPLEISSQKKISLSKIKDSADSSEDNKIKVKSLEEIQRAKALLSMGLIELKSGKIVKVGEVDKYREVETEEKMKKETEENVIKETEEKVKKEPPKKKKIIKKVVTKSKKPLKKVEEKVEEDDTPVIEKSTNADYGDDLDDLGEEPEIDIYEAIDEDIGDPGSQDLEESEEEDQNIDGEQEEQEQVSSSEEEPVQYQEDIRRAVRKDVDVNVSPPKTRVISTQLKRQRKIIVEEERQKEEKQNMEVTQRLSIHSRLGRKVDSAVVKSSSGQASKDSIDSKVGNLQKTLIKASVKSRVGTTIKETSDNTIGSSNAGTIKGIKSRLGIGTSRSDTGETQVSSSEPRKMILKRTIENNLEDDDTKREVSKRRRWNKGSAKSRLGQSGSDANVDTDLKKIVITRNIVDDEDSRSNDATKQKKHTNTSSENKSQVKSTLSRINKIIEEKKDSKDQDSSKRNIAKLNIWSSRISESIAAVAPSRKQSNIDLHDSSSNDSMSADTSLSKKEAKVKKLLKQERALYVPPGRKRPAASYDDQEEEITPPKPSKKHKEKNSESETIKTYSQIMEEKRKKLEKQREKKAKAEEKAVKKKLKKDKENEKGSEATVKTTEVKPSEVMPDLSNRRDSLLDSLDFIMPDKPEKKKPELTSDHTDLLSSVTPDDSEQKIINLPPSRKKSDDSWLEFSKEDLELTVEGDTADDDDLLREIDELLA